MLVRGQSPALARTLQKSGQTQYLSCFTSAPSTTARCSVSMAVALKPQPAGSADWRKNLVTDPAEVLWIAGSAKTVAVLGCKTDKQVC